MCGRRSLRFSLGLRNPEFQFGSFLGLSHLNPLISLDLSEDVEDFEVVEREEVAEEQRATGEDGGGQREDGNEY
ncbi:hypothetical protein ACFX1Q_010405 [Malus domestica]